MNPQLTLTYFNGRGLAELTRLVLAQGDIPYKDVRIDKKDWENLKGKTPWGQVPILEITDPITNQKTTLGQSGTIARYVASLASLNGKNALESAQIESVCDAVTDLTQQLAKAYYLGTIEEKKKATDDNNKTHIPNWAARFEKHLTDNKEGNKEFFLGERITLADIAVYRVFWEILQNQPTALQDYPFLFAHVARVGKSEKIARWIADRPLSEF